MNRATHLLVAASFAAAKSLKFFRKPRLVSLLIIATAVFVPHSGLAAVYYDNTDDVNPNLGTTYGGTLDIVSAEVTRNSSTGWFTFKLTVNGNLSSNSGGMFVIGIDDQSGAILSAYDYVGFLFDMSVSSGTGFSHLLQVGVDSGGWAYLDKADPATSSFIPLDDSSGRLTVTLSPGSNSTITIGVPPDYFDSFYFDVYSMNLNWNGADALSNPDPITDWNPYISSYPYYKFFYPPPSSYSLTLSSSSYGLVATATDLSSGNVLSAAFGQTKISSFPAGSFVTIGLSGAVNGDVARWEVWDSVSGERTTNYSFYFPPTWFLSMNRAYKVDVSVVGYSYSVWAGTSGSSLPSDRRGWTNRNGPLNLPNGISYAMGFGPTNARAGDLPFLVGAPAAGSNTVKFRYFEGRSPSAYYPLFEGPQIYAATNLAGPWTNANVLSKTNLATPSASTPVEATVGVPAGASNFFLRLQAVGF